MIIFAGQAAQFYLWIKEIKKRRFTHRLKNITIFSFSSYLLRISPVRQAKGNGLQNQQRQINLLGLLHRHAAKLHTFHQCCRDNCKSVCSSWNTSNFLTLGSQNQYCVTNAKACKKLHAVLNFTSLLFFISSFLLVSFLPPVPSLFGFLSFW